MMLKMLKMKSKKKNQSSLSLWMKKEWYNINFKINKKKLSNPAKFYKNIKSNSNNKTIKSQR